MPAAVGHELPHQVAAGHRQIAHKIQGLMPDTFVFKSQWIVDRAMIVKNQQVTASDARAAR